MMHSLMGMGMPDHATQVYSSVPVFDDFSRQQPLAESARRISRGSSNGYRPATSMRVAKPSSASNSPQAMAQRRRTLMNDGNLARRRQYALDQAILNHQIQNAVPTYDAYPEPVKRTTRPMSWHPSSQIQQPALHIQQMPQFDISQYMLPTTTPYSEADLYSGYQPFPPTPAVYSGQTSPASAFSPLSLPFAASSQPPVQHGMALDSSCSWNTPSYISAAPLDTSGSPDATEPFPTYLGQASLDWEAFAANGFNICTAPPTPDNYQQVVPAEPSVPAEECIPYQALDEPEEEGEILVGMGLYDAPDKSETDPELDHYRTTTSHLLGSTYRKGAGLKLEEAWEPPKDDDSSNDEDNADSET
ncbi:hypothetical protein SCUP515_05752 [Seiridium cupressi]